MGDSIGIFPALNGRGVFVPQAFSHGANATEQVEYVLNIGHVKYCSLIVLFSQT